MNGQFDIGEITPLRYFAALAVLTGLLFPAHFALGDSSESADASFRVFFVDSEGGQDGNDGLSEDHAWQTLERVNAAELKPGDTVREVRLRKAP